MQIIPVIDLMDGQVVHAKHGNRAQYAPINSLLCKGSDPITIVQSLLELYPFPSLYIADLDAIQAKSDHHRTIHAILQTFPQLTIWLDAGDVSKNADRQCSHPRIRMIIGSESVDSLSHYNTSLGKLNAPILSLDFKDGRFLGPTELLESSYWPEDVIVMSLNRVGSHAGPDVALLEQIKQQASHHRIFAAGGVRQASDIALLQTLHVDGALIATSLHTNMLTAQELATIHTPRHNG